MGVLDKLSAWLFDEEEDDKLEGSSPTETVVDSPYQQVVDEFKMYCTRVLTAELIVSNHERVFSLYKNHPNGADIVDL
ncbi:unnamed protein product [Nippostrongylus brasiliensis]|uniref:DNA helicase n=1 Tax=Nippostrongylus brasiliensis TaxID=27835 RepID=A0A0N4Y1Q3_NIPBR|nr:unnamed protein product [Nippostrongylus brasiliensis]